MSEVVEVDIRVLCGSSFRGVHTRYDPRPLELSACDQSAEKGHIPRTLLDNFSRPLGSGWIRIAHTISPHKIKPATASSKICAVDQVAEKDSSTLRYNLILALCLQRRCFVCLL